MNETMVGIDLKEVHHYGGICFAVSWYETREQADVAGYIVRKRGDTANGGFMDGGRLGRCQGRDQEGRYAVSHAGHPPQGHHEVPLEAFNAKQNMLHAGKKVVLEIRRVGMGVWVCLCQERGCTGGGASRADAVEQCMMALTEQGEA